MTCCAVTCFTVAAGLASRTGPPAAGLCVFRWAHRGLGGSPMPRWLLDFVVRPFKPHSSSQLLTFIKKNWDALICEPSASSCPAFICITCLKPVRDVSRMICVYFDGGLIEAATVRLMIAQKLLTVVLYLSCWAAVLLKFACFSAFYVSSCCWWTSVPCSYFDIILNRPLIIQFWLYCTFKCSCSRNWLKVEIRVVVWLYFRDFIVIKVSLNFLSSAILFLFRY